MADKVTAKREALRAEVKRLRAFRDAVLWWMLSRERAVIGYGSDRIADDRFFAVIAAERAALAKKEGQ